jgi:hypothetical protein
METKKIEVVVKFNQQQLELLDALKKEGKYGNTYEEIVVNVFRDYIRQNFGKRGA